MGKFIFGLIVDAKLVRKRKFYLISFGLILSLSFVLCTWLRYVGPLVISLFLFIGHFSIVFIDTVMESIVVQ
jgi:hypothetical protein